MTLLLRTLQDRPGNEDQLRGLFRDAIETGRMIERTKEQQVRLLHDIRIMRQDFERGIIRTGGY